jgi:hypothetical protein
MNPKRNSDKPVPLDTLYKRLGRAFTEIIDHPDTSPQVIKFFLGLSALAGKTRVRIARKPNRSTERG